MRATIATLFVLLCVWSVTSFAPHQHCGVEDLFEFHHGTNFSTKAIGAADCPIEGVCDQASVRDGSKAGTLTIPIVFHVIQTASGKNPNGISLSNINGAVTQLQQDFSSYGINFELEEVIFHPFPSKYVGYSCLSAYGTNDWMYELDAIKEAYAVTPNKAINIFVTCQDQNAGQGTLLGVGTFPWDPTATQSLGGLWVNAVATDYGKKTITHEMGHNLGLWHTFHGVSEVASCSNCYEYVHEFEDPAANSVGDFCSDTAATPLNYECSQPSGRDCKRVAWGDTDVENFMAYGSDTCMGQFSNQQRDRMHCWVCDALPGIAIGCP